MRLADFTAGANQFETTFVVEAGDPHITNNNIPLTDCIDTPDVRATKTADRTTARFGDTVNFTLVFKNNTARSYLGASQVDLLPEGLIYTPGSATLNGVAAEPAIMGKRLVLGAARYAACGPHHHSVGRTCGGGWQRRQHHQPRAARGCDRCRAIKCGGGDHSHCSRGGV